MKVLFKNMINGYTGVVDDYVMYYSRRYNKVIIRQRPLFKKLAHQNEFKIVMANLKALNPSMPYREDLKAYCTAFNLVKHNYSNEVTWTNIWQKLMWMMVRIIPGVNLQTITRQEIYTRDLPCLSVKKAVEAGLLAPVHGYQELVAEM